jgi:hypothetical protein
LRWVVCSYSSKLSLKAVILDLLPHEMQCRTSPPSLQKEPWLIFVNVARVWTSAGEGCYDDWFRRDRRTNATDRYVCVSFLRSKFCMDLYRHFAFSHSGFCHVLFAYGIFTQFCFVRS